MRRVNARYVIATSTKVDLNGVDSKTLDKISEPKYFTKDKKAEKAKTEEAFFKQGEKPEVITSFYGKISRNFMTANRSTEKITFKWPGGGSKDR